ncbi:uncharacterized protein LOC123865356 isoform X2 [Maniola jurtina]|uniref:uncharacterized protein LOC123865356 isoform X2 n=1 Tax=Maniola jurtina TaxID=191418 RepID=UPI001E68CC85|nr:uncharacterized protein LOC123865356 isoform X2 [Maniola jurtina]
MFALLLLLHHASASDTPQEAPIIKKIASCPDVGYYFTQESNLNAIEPICYLCFCQDDNTAVCWLREPRRCDVKHYQHYGRKKRLSRVRRSPGFNNNILFTYFSQGGNVSFAPDTNVTEKIFVYNTSDSDDKILNKTNYFKHTVFEVANLNGNKNSNETHVEQYLTPNTAKNTSSKATSNAVDLKINASNENIHGIDKDKAKVQDCYHNFTLKNNVGCEKICKFGNTNTTTPVKNKIKNNNILKYLKRKFRKVFIKKKVKNNNTIQQSNRKHHLIRTICQNFGSCTIDFKNKKILYNIEQLRAESTKIMQSVNSIKGLLKLLDINRKTMKKNFIGINEQICNDNIDELNAIIKDNYDEYNLDNLTETQSVQISYIKQNIEIFMQSMEKFAQILNDIVQVLTNNKTHYLKVSNYYFHRNPKKQVITKVIKNDTIGEKLDKIKELLTNYNLVQNKFVKRMYDIMKPLGPKTNQTKNNNVKNNKDTSAIEIYTQNIIENLSKLKNLAQKLSCKNRKKREAIDDDVVEYLLILMEYLLKQQKQLKISPEYDGIDLLIEAIKSAPDIKATRKKVLDPLNMEMETTKAASSFLNANKIIDETVDTSNAIIPKFKTFESIDEDEESSDLYQYNKKFHKKNNFKQGKFEAKDVTPSYDIDLSDDGKTSAVLDKTDTKKKDDSKEIEVFIDDADDDAGIIMTTTESPDKSIVEVEESETVRYNTPMRTYYPHNKLRDEQSVHKDTNDTYIRQYNRIKLDWVEDSYTQDEERKELPRFIETTTQKLTPTHTILAAEVILRTTRKQEKKADKYDNPLSSISRETEDENRKMTKKLNPENVMYKKQMNLLNSLDYGTEKIEIEEDSTEEKSNVEQFPPYFV